MLKKSFSFLLLALLFINCAELKKLSNVQKPTISVNDFKVTKLSFQDIELTFDLEVSNPNPVALSLASYTYDLQIEENSFVKGTQSIETSLEANGSSIISIPVAFTYADLYNTFTTIHSEKEGDYSFFGNVSVNVPVLGLLEIPIEKKGTFPIVKVPTVSLSKFSVKDLSFTKADVELELNIGNPNNFTMVMEELDYNINFNGFDSIKGKTAHTVTIDGNETRIISIPASFNFLELGSAAYSAIVGSTPFEYSLTGSTSIGASLPYFDLSSFNFDKSGVVDILR